VARHVFWTARILRAQDHHAHWKRAVHIFMRRHANGRAPAQQLGIDAQRPRLGLVDVEPHRLRQLVPVEVDVARVGIGFEHLADLLGDGADVLRILAQHAEHHRVGDRRAVLQARDAAAHRLEMLLE